MKRVVLPQYGMGDWLQQNAGMVGTVVGTGAGLALAPLTGGASMALSGVGSQIGNSIQGNYEQEQAMDDAIAQNQANNKLTTARSKVNQAQMSQRGSGLQGFANGGDLNKVPKIPTGGSRNIIPKYTTQSGKQWFPVKPTPDAIRDTANFFPVGVGDNNEPIFGTYNKELIDDTILYKSSIDKDNKIYHPSSTLKRLLAKPPTEEFLKSQPRFDFPGFKNGGMLGQSNAVADGGITKYSGQTHDGPDGGIPVDASGSPVAMSGQDPVGLVEDGEVSWTDPVSKSAYIFSNKLTV